MTIPRTAARYALYGALATWLYATAVSQVPDNRYHWARKLVRSPVVIPTWTFFGPNPGTRDDHLLYRDELPDGSFTEWREVLGHRRRRLSHAVWNPYLRQEKAVIDAVDIVKYSVRELRKDGLDERVQGLDGYQILLSYIINYLPHSPSARAMQFLIATSTGCEEDEEPELLFASAIHEIGNGSEYPAA